MISTRYTIITFILCTFMMSSEWIGLNGSAQTRFESKTLLLLMKFAIEKKDRKIIIMYIVTNFSFEKYNTKYIYFLV